MTDQAPASNAVPPGSRPLRTPSHERYAFHRALMRNRRDAAELAGLSRTSGACTKIEQQQAVQDRIAFLSAKLIDRLAHEGEVPTSTDDQNMPVVAASARSAGDEPEARSNACARVDIDGRPL
jgi:hypothetical protein